MILPLHFYVGWPWKSIRFHVLESPGGTKTLVKTVSAKNCASNRDKDLVASAVSYGRSLFDTENHGTLSPSLFLGLSLLVMVSWRPGWHREPWNEFPFCFLWSLDCSCWWWVLEALLVVILGTKESLLVQHIAGSRRTFQPCQISWNFHSVLCYFILHAYCLRRWCLSYFSV